MSPPELPCPLGPACAQVPTQHCLQRVEVLLGVGLCPQWPWAPGADAAWFAAVFPVARTRAARMLAQVRPWLSGSFILPWHTY